MIDAITAIIWDPGADAVLVERDDRRHRLPVLAVNDAGFGASLPGAIRAAFGISAVLLENLDPAVYVVEVRGPSRLTVSGQSWVPVGDLALAGTDAFWMAGWLARRECPLRPWFEQGWVDRALADVDAVLADSGRVRIGEAAQIKHWALSTVMRVETTQGPVFFKAAPSEAAIEPLLLARLADRWLMSVPKLLAHSPEDSWWVTEGFVGRERAELTPEDQIACVELLAQMQIEIANDPAILAGLQIKRVSLEDLAACVPELMGRVDRWHAMPAEHEHWWPLDAEQRECWCGLGPTLIERIETLADATAALDLPLSLIHGDFHTGNMVARDEGPLLHDWANGMVTHPLFDLAMLLNWVDDDIADGCLTAYLRQWQQAGRDLEALRMLWQIAKPVSALFEVERALRVCDELGEEHQFEMISVLYSWIRRLLGAIADESGATVGWSTSGIAAKR